MNKEEYEKNFDGALSGNNMMTKAEKALDLALDIRKFEIELYWKRATYFWTFIGAALAGYALVYSKAKNDDSWLLLVFSCLGLLFSIAWYLVNRGSKFWQNNWERHVDILEDMVVGPLYKTIAHNITLNNPLTAPAEYSVSKINQILSLFISLFWVLLITKSLMPISCSSTPDYIKIGVLLLTAMAALCLFVFATSGNKETKTKLTSRKVTIE